MIRIVLIVLIITVIFFLIWNFYPKIKTLLLRTIKRPIGILFLKKIIRFIIRRFIG